MINFIDYLHRGAYMTPKRRASANNNLTTWMLTQISEIHISTTMMFSTSSNNDGIGWTILEHETLTLFCCPIPFQPL